MNSERPSEDRAAGEKGEVDATFVIGGMIRPPKKTGISIPVL
jgi:hypothetical protein